MNNSLRSIERALICLTSQVILEPIANDYVELWKECIELGRPFVAPEELAAVAEAAGVPVLTDIPLYAYLDQCIDDRRIPDPQRIIECIVHGYAEEHFNTGRCSCPARRTLIPQLNPKREDADDFLYPPLVDPEYEEEADKEERRRPEYDPDEDDEYDDEEEDDGEAWP